MVKAVHQWFALIIGGAVTLGLFIAQLFHGSVPQVVYLIIVLATVNVAQFQVWRTDKHRNQEAIEPPRVS